MADEAPGVEGILQLLSEQPSAAAQPSPPSASPPSAAAPTPPMALAAQPPHAPAHAAAYPPAFPGAAPFYDPSAAPGPSFGQQDADGDEYRFNPHHKVHFTSPNSVMFSLPNDSRLFVGNLASEKTSKEEMARIFAQYGDVYEIVIKDSYGFIQYDNAESVLEAIRMENGRLLAGLKLDLSVAKNRRERRAEQERDRAMRETFGRDREPPRGFGPYRGSDRRDARDRPYDSRERTRGRNRGDSYSPERRRSYSPPYSRGGPPGRNDSPLMSILGGRLRLDIPISTSDFLLPRRYGTNVPEVQVIVIGQVDKQYVLHVENRFRGAGMHVEVLFLSAKLSLELVLQQMNYEGVRAVVFVERGFDATETVTMLIFDGSTGYVEYDRVGLDKAVADVRMQKNAVGMAVPPPAAYPPKPVVPLASNPGALPPPNLDFNALSNLLGAIQGGAPPARPPVAGYGVPQMPAGGPAMQMPGQPPMQPGYGVPPQSADVSSLLSMLSGSMAGQKPPGPPGAAPGYPPVPQAGPPGYPSAIPPQGQQFYPGQPPPQQPSYSGPPPQRGGYAGAPRGGYRGR
ncbi:hypothetical protein DFJ74DRAFT_468365 [Hyaloraphidium curvatum]|nr:hypothetical protein DFJ74DRAFT_468365 [Hyaloraphidium curvatum]